MTLEWCAKDLVFGHLPLPLMVAMRIDWIAVVAQNAAHKHCRGNYNIRHICANAKDRKREREAEKCIKNFHILHS